MTKCNVYYVNAIGLAEIKQHLADKHKLGGDHFTDSMIRAWAAEVEKSIDEGNSACFEISCHYSISGHTELCRISDDGISFDVVEIED